MSMRLKAGCEMTLLCFQPTGADVALITELGPLKTEDLRVWRRATSGKDQSRHAEPILILASAADLLSCAGAPPLVLSSGKTNPGSLVHDADADDALPDFIPAIGGHRHHERELDPPMMCVPCGIESRV